MAANTAKATTSKKWPKMPMHADYQDHVTDAHMKAIDSVEDQKKLEKAKARDKAAW